MPAIENADQATQTAVAFVKKHRPLAAATPRKATKANGTWVVELDLGFIITQVGKVVLDANSGAVTEYDFPP